MLLTKKRIRNFISQKSIKSKLIAAFLTFALLLLMIIISFFWFDSQENRIENIVRSLVILNLKINQINNVEKDFFQIETHSDDFYRTGKSTYLEKHKKIFVDLKLDLSKLKKSDLLSNQILLQIDTVTNQIESFEYLFDKLVNLIRIRGFEDYGLEGEMRRFIHQIEDSASFIGLTKILTIRRYEKDFIIRKDEKYVEKLIFAVESLREEVNNTAPNEYEKRKIGKLLDLYKATFMTMVNVEKQIGFKNQSGLKDELNLLTIAIDQNIQEIEKKVFTQADKLRKNITTILIVLTALFLILIFILAMYVIQKLGSPLNRLADSMQAVIDNKFKEGVEIDTIWSSDETGKIAQQVEIMVNQVRENMQEIVYQKEKIAEAYEDVYLLSSIGREITAHLAPEKILEVVYEHICKLMDVAYFVVFVPHPYKQNLSILIEKGQKTAFSLEKKNQNPNLFLAELSFKNKDEIYINDFETEKSDYFESEHKNLSLIECKSLLFMPLISNQSAIGVLSLQSKQKKAYTAYHLNLLHNLVIYITIALDNAKIYKRLDEKNQKIIDSISYAQRIQDAILPKIDTIQKALPDFFAFFKPRDIVSGDFYWYAEVEARPIYEEVMIDNKQGFRKIFKGFTTTKHIIAAVDCTGHGVPGAFMSMIGNDLLNSIIIEEGITSPDLILDKLHLGVRYALRQKENENPDGMDIAICVIDLEEKILEYAGAYNPLIFIRDKQINIIQADKKPVGGWYDEDENLSTSRFQKHSVELNETTMFYIFSDGFADQLGGQGRRKFMNQQLRELLFHIHEENISKQQEMLEETLQEWIGYGKQNDDILIMGFRIPANQETNNK